MRDLKEAALAFDAREFRTLSICCQYLLFDSFTTGAPLTVVSNSGKPGSWIGMLRRPRRRDLIAGGSVNAEHSPNVLLNQLVGIGLDFSRADRFVFLGEILADQRRRNRTLPKVVE